MVLQTSDLKSTPRAKAAVQTTQALGQQRKKILFLMCDAQENWQVENLGSKKGQFSPIFLMWYCGYFRHYTIDKFFSS